MIEGTITFDSDYMAFCTPQPDLQPKYLAIIYPFSKTVWLFVGTMTVLVSLMLFAIATYEQYHHYIRFSEWNTFTKSIIFTFGSFIKEPLLLSNSLIYSNALMILVGFWLLYCLVMSASYGGNLTTYLTTPTYSKSINTLQEVRKVHCAMVSSVIHLFTKQLYQTRFGPVEGSDPHESASGFEV